MKTQGLIKKKVLFTQGFWIDKSYPIKRLISQSAKVLKAEISEQYFQEELLKFKGMRVGFKVEVSLVGKEGI